MNRFDKMMTKLAYSRVLTVRFQAIHLAVNYSLLALAMAIYLVFATSTWIIVAACVPGAFIFFISVQALSYRKALEGGDMLEFVNQFMIK